MALPHLARWLLVLALIVMPVSMLRGHVAAAPLSEAVLSQADDGHCAGSGLKDQGSDHKAPGASLDCTIACACVPPSVASLPAAPPVIAGAATAAIVAAVSGSNPSADPPPPRIS